MKFIHCEYGVTDENIKNYILEKLVLICLFAEVGIWQGQTKA